MNIPNDLKVRPYWVVWRLQHFPGEKKPRKVPYYANGAARSGTQGDEGDRAQLVTYDQAAAAAARGDYSGVGIAILPDSGIVALDFDDVVSEGEVDPRVLDIVSGTYAEFSPSGSGVRAFFAGRMQSRKDLVQAKSRVRPEDWFAIEVFGTSGFVTVTGRALPDVELFGLTNTLTPITAAVREMYAARWPAAIVDPLGGGVMVADDAWLVALTPKLGMTREEVERALAAVPPSEMDYDDWLKVGMAVHHELGADAFDVWHEWSKTSDKYTTEQYGRERWRSFGKYSGGSHLTMAWVLKQVKETRVRERYDARRGWATQITSTKDEYELRETVCTQIAQDVRLGEIEREELAHVLLAAMKGLGKKLPIAACRKLLAEKRPQKNRGDIELPGWAQGWVYVTDKDKFFRVDSEEWLSMQGFNAMFNREMPRGEDGGIINVASHYALTDLEIENVTRAIYLPYAESIFELDGTRCVNLYRPSSVPAVAEEMTAAGQRAVALVQRHLSLMCGGRQQLVETLLAWMAHNVQKPGIKIMWAPLIKGIEGDGKSVLAKLMQGVMGTPNVKMISNEALASGFTGWASGAAVGVLEEVRIVGSQSKTRYDVLNALKPYVTNVSVPVHPKGKDEYNIINVTNYIGFTNFSDALPLNDTDRRWLVIFSPFTCVAELAASVGGDLGAYFDSLHAGIESHTAELRRWLLTYPIPATFRPTGRAPDTDEKLMMIALSSTPEEDIAREIIEEGADGVGPRVLSSAHLNTAMQMRHGERLNTTAVNRLLAKLGWAKLPQKMRWKGAVCTIWTRGRVDGCSESLKRELDATTAKSAEKSFSENSDPIFGDFLEVD